MSFSTAPYDSALKYIKFSSAMNIYADPRNSTAHVVMLVQKSYEIFVQCLEKVQIIFFTA